MTVYLAYEFWHFICDTFYRQSNTNNPLKSLDFTELLQNTLSLQKVEKWAFYHRRRSSKHVHTVDDKTHTVNVRHETH